MFKDLNLDIKYWDKFVQTANYLQNQSPISPISMTAYKAETGNKLELKHLWIISTTGFTIDQKPQTNWKKF